MRTEVFSPIYMVSTGSKGRGLWVSTFQPRMGVGAVREMGGAYRFPYRERTGFSQFSWGRWAELGCSRRFPAHGKVRKCFVVLFLTVSIILVYYRS